MEKLSVISVITHLSKADSKQSIVQNRGNPPSSLSLFHLNESCSHIIETSRDAGHYKPV